MLTQACEYRRSFMLTLVKMFIWFTHGDTRKYLRQYIEWNEDGLIPSC